MIEAIGRRVNINDNSVTLYYYISLCIGPDDGHLMAETCCPF